MKYFKSAFLFLCTLVAAAALSAPLQAAAPAHDYLANNTVLIIRHAEKPPLGRELTPTGQERANDYAHYFEPFRDGGLNFRVDALYAGADSKDSIRPRLTLEPLGRAAALAVNSTVSTKDPEALVQLLRTQPHGRHPLVAWRHGSIPALLTAFGASPELLPNGKWPNDVYDWVIVLTFDSQGHLRTQRLVKETLVLQ